jgi:uncharacterized protein (TIGR03067 family)
MRSSRAIALTLLVAGAWAPARAGTEPPPDGAWAVAEVTLNGESRAEGKLLNSTWTFKGDELILQPASGARTRWSLSYDLDAEPPALRATPVDAGPGERPLWMILSRTPGELRLAFYDGLDQRPEDFGPRRKLVVLRLVPAPAAALIPDPCEILRSAGVEGLLGGPTKRKAAPTTATRPGVTCALEREDGAGAVTLTLIPPPAATPFLDAARREAFARQRTPLEDEPSLGPGAFSAIRGWTLSTVALKQGTAMLLRVEAPTVPRGEARRFAERVHAQL